MKPADQLGRPMRDLRISVTDRCNFRCTYCMPRRVFGPGFVFLPREALLTFEELARLARVFAALGVRKLRLTGGEPLLRRDLEVLVRLLSAVDGIEDLAMTTNGALLAERAADLRAAGLNRVTVSLDALDEATFRAMSDVPLGPAAILDAIDAASAAGLGPVRVNMVVKRGVNDDQIEPMARHFRGSGNILRFIEYMDVGNANGWRMDEVVPAREILGRIGARWPLSELPKRYPGEVANRFRYADDAGEIGIVASVTQPFCGGCSRARLTADGQLLTCLFASRGEDLRTHLKGGISDEELLKRLGAIWGAREDRYSELRSAATERLPRFEMSRIGG